MVTCKKMMEQKKLFSKTIRNSCPYCQKSYKFFLELELKTTGLTTSLIKPHKDCKRFIIFVDPNGAVRGTQCIDSGAENEESPDNLNTEIYVKLFEDQENISEFYHVIEFNGEELNNKSSLITSRKVKYHKLLRSVFYREWINDFHENKREFAFMYIDDIFVLTINLYDMILFTLGIPLDQLNFNIELDEMSSVIDFVKGKAVSLGEKILS